MDEKGRVWMATVSRQGALPTFCTDGSVASSKYFPFNAPKGQPFPMYDPATKKVTVFSLCGGGNHISFGWDKDSTVYLNAAPDAMSWFKTKVWDDTHDIKKAYAWCPMVLDTNGDGKIDADRAKWNEPDKPVDPKKDTRITTHLYGLNVGKDGNVWSADYVPYVPSRIVRLNLGSNPPETCKAEVYEPPMKDGKYLAYGARGLSVDSDGVVWTAFSSGHVGAFDRRKCKVTNGPTATGQQCPEGWKIYDLPGPKMVGTNVTTNIVYGSPVDFENVSGLGKDTVFFPAMNSDSILALDRKTDKFLVFRVPYPMGFYTRDMHFRIDDPKAGWKGRTIHATYSDVAMWHQEDGEGAYSKIATFQIRPDPLAH